MNAVTEIGVDTMPKCSPEELENWFGGLAKSIPDPMREAVRRESRIEAEKDNWQHEAPPYVNAALANVGVQLPILFVPLIYSVMGPDLAESEREACKTFLLGQVVKSLKKYDPYQGASVVGYVRRRIVWKYQRFMHRLSRREFVYRQADQLQAANVADSRDLEQAANRNADCSALQLILIGETVGDRVILAECKLTEKERTAIYLRFFRHVTVEDLAKASGISESGIENRIQRGKKRLATYCKVRGKDLENQRWEAAKRGEPKLSQHTGKAFLRHCGELLAK